MGLFIVTIDQGSSGTKVLAFDRRGDAIYRSFRPLKISRPSPAHVEQNPRHVLEETRSALEEVLSSIDHDGHEIAAIGLACQRSSFILWDKKSGTALTPILSWQDLRAKDLCSEFIAHREMIYHKTGLPLTGHYGGPKFLWLLRHMPEISQWIRSQDTVYSPWSSFLLWHLTEEQGCAVDESIAGRSLFFDISERSWDKTLSALFQVPLEILPEIRPTNHLYGHYSFRNRLIPVVCSVGDHQAALLGMGGFEKGRCALNYGTSGGALIHIGPKPQVAKGLLTNIAYSSLKEVFYAAEGTVNAVGSLFEWFEIEKGVKGASRDWETRMAPSSQGWLMLPGMYGIAAPYWRETVPTLFLGKGKMPAPEILMRAGMESIAFLMADILERLRLIPGFEVQKITAGGGAAQRPLLQFQADILGRPIHHASIADATALGCAFLTGLQVGYWKGLEEIQPFIQEKEIVEARIPLSQRQALLDAWHQFLRRNGILQTLERV
jgi:glycerol kinase